MVAEVVVELVVEVVLPRLTRTSWPSEAMDKRLARSQSSWTIEREGRGSECEIDAYVVCALPNDGKQASRGRGEHQRMVVGLTLEGCGAGVSTSSSAHCTSVAEENGLGCSHLVWGLGVLGQQVIRSRW